MPSGAKLYASCRGFDPITITMQITVMMLTYLASLCSAVVICDIVAGLRPHSAQIFSSMVFDNLRDKYGTCTLVAQWISILPFSIAQPVVVEKASKCLDYTATVCILRIVSFCFLSQFPTQFWFWVNEVAWATVTCLLSEYLCMKSESKEIPLKINELLEQSAVKAKRMISKIQKSGEPKLKLKVEDESSQVIDNRKETVNRHKKDEHVWADDFGQN